MHRNCVVSAWACACATGCLALVACDGAPRALPDAPTAPLAPTANLQRGIAQTEVTLDLERMQGTATLTVEPHPQAGATFAIGDLDIRSVVDADGSPVLFEDAGASMHLGLGPAETARQVTVAYDLHVHNNSDGVARNANAAYSLTWPYHCGNVFPCHTNPDDGTAFSVAVNNVPAGQRAVLPVGLVAEAPAYQLAFAVGAYTDVVVGRTMAGTQIVASHLPGQAAAAAAGTANLVAAFSWFESTLGPYLFGNVTGPVAVAWGAGAFGGMEHHPRWHVATAALSDEETNVHEAAHAWFGDGIRIKCWEDFVLSEGTVTYLAGRALDVVAPAVGAQVWQRYTAELARIPATAPVWPQGCNQIDVIEDGLFSRAPYIRGAMFFRALAERIGAGQLDAALAAFYQAKRGQAATMQELLDAIAAQTGFNPAVCAAAWLRSTTIPTPGPCL